VIPGIQGLDGIVFLLENEKEFPEGISVE